MKKSNREELLSLLKDFILNKTGIIIKNNKDDFLWKIISQRSSEKNLNPEEYINSFLSSVSGYIELDYLTEKIVTGETSFFRNLPQMQVLENEVLPQILKYKKEFGEKFISLWSAGSSTGEEVYTLALILYDQLQWKRDFEVSIMGTDICKSFLNKASTGEYHIDKLAEIPDKYHKYLIVKDKYFTFIPEIKALVKFKYLNLVSEIYPMGLDVIFCRNVMIYFPLEFRKKIITKFYRCLNKKGYMFLGHSENLYGLTGWKQIFSQDAVYYFKE